TGLRPYFDSTGLWLERFGRSQSAQRMEGEAQADIRAMRSHSPGHGRAHRRDEDDGLLSGHFGGQEINEVGNVGPRPQSQGGPPDPVLKNIWWQLLEWRAGVEPICHARSRRTVQVAQHNHGLAPTLLKIQ